MTKQEVRTAILEFFTGHGYDICKAKTAEDGFFVKGEGFMRFEEARKIAGIAKHTPAVRTPRARILPYGDYATIAAINGRLKG